MGMPFVRVLVASLLGFALAPVALRAQGAVLVVDADAGPYFTVQSAVDAAADGDTILMHAGYYGRFVVAGRSLTIAAADGALVYCADDFFSAMPNEIKDLAAADVVVLRGLQLVGLTISGAAGTVWVEDCDLTYAGTPLVVEDSAGVVLVRDTFTANSGFIDPGAYFSQSATDAVRLTDSKVAMYDCTAKAGNGTNFTTTVLGPAFPAAGKDAIRVHGGELRMSGGSAIGGNGGNGGNGGLWGCFAGREGGSGVHLVDGAAMLAVNDVVLQGGAGGAAPASCDAFGDPDSGAPGSPVLNQGTGSVTTLPGPARRLQVASPVSEGQVKHLLVSGAPGDAVLVLVGLQPRLAFKPAHVGSLLSTPVVLVLPLGTLGNPAELDLPFSIVELGPGVATVHAVLQGAFKPAGGGHVLGSGSVLIALDSIY